ncbi:hypothetical protein DB347_18120 [Opitutaceae bacterium EW11]|nr:hypothetical protein DB347_18120 [Opitutaceae bacterium EW11]
MRSSNVQQFLQAQLSGPLRGVLLLFLLLGGIGNLRGEASTSAALENALRKLVDGKPFTVGFAVKDLVSGEELSVGADQPFRAGAMVRLPLLVELYRRAAAHEFSLDEARELPDAARSVRGGILRLMHGDTFRMSLRDYALFMIVLNDPTATRYIADLVGMERTSEAMKQLGSPEFQCVRRGRDRVSAEATPISVVRLLERIHSGSVIDHATSVEILAVLANERVGLHRMSVPRGVEYAGISSGPIPGRRCEAGVVFLPGRPYVFCGFVSRNDRDGMMKRQRGGLPEEDRILAEAMRLVHEHFSGLSGIAP